MNSSRRRSHWVPKEAQSSSPDSYISRTLSVKDQSPSYKPETGSSYGGSGSKWSHVVTPPNVSCKPFAQSSGAPASGCYSSGRFQSPPTCSSSRVEFGSLCRNSDHGVRNVGEVLEEKARHLSGERDKFRESCELPDSCNKQDQGSLERMDTSGNGAPFDICNVKLATGIQLKTPIHLKNREKRKENKRSIEGPDIKVLRPGMVHLRNYISVADQVRIVETCRKLGPGPGGFYQSFYRNGLGKLHLKMMCLGKNWDSQNSKYIDASPGDGAKTLSIPGEFGDMVDLAVRDSHDFMRKQSVKNIEETLPSMTPDICIVNFYTKSGKLGLHQDKDESKESLRGGLPVVSFSIGDSAEFVYGDEGDLDKMEKVLLESGDVLIFGGRSRNVFHGVTAINAETGPKVLLEESNLRPGRLNLTFRKF